jgi:G3E family GTPase
MTDRWIAEAYQLDGVVTTVDLATGSHTLDEHKESVKQAALADLLLLTKGDIIDTPAKEALINRLNQINPSASKLEVTGGKADPNQLLNLGLFTTEGKLTDVEAWLKEEVYAEQHDHHHDHDCHEQGCDHDHAKRHGDSIESFCLTVEKPISKEALQDWMQLLMSLVGSNILRIKGLLNIEGVEEPLVIHGVQQLFHPPVPLPAWPNDDKRTRLVFITQNVSRAFIENTFKELVDITES